MSSSSSAYLGGAQYSPSFPSHCGAMFPIMERNLPYPDGADVDEHPWHDDTSPRSAVTTSSTGMDSHYAVFNMYGLAVTDHEHELVPSFSGEVLKHTDIMPDDKRNLLSLMGHVNIAQDPTQVSQQFSEQLQNSLYNPIQPNCAPSIWTRHYGRPTKANVSSEAGKAASESRRKAKPSFFCELRETCGASFTRKNGLLSNYLSVILSSQLLTVFPSDHYKAHLGITDKRCRYCNQAFTTSVGRHEKKCKRNPHYQTFY